MSYSINKKGEIIVSGWDAGIAQSPHKGIANMQAVNISTETGEVMCSYSRVQQSQTSMSGTFTQIDSSTVQVSNPSPSNAILTLGMWVTVSASTIANLSNGDYYVASGNFGGNLRYNLKSAFTSNNDYINSFGSGTASFSTTIFDMASPIASATENYFDANNTAQFRYYILDSNGRLWVQDTSPLSVSNITKPLWFLPKNTTITSYGSGAGITNVSGLAILNGWVHVFGGNGIFVKSTVQLWKEFVVFSAGSTMGLPNNTLPHTAFVGHQGKLYYCDDTYLGSIFPNTSLLTGVNNIQSYAAYTSAGTTNTMTNLISGSIPSTASGSSSSRIPAVFFPSQGGSNPSAISEGTLYYIKWLGSGTFEVYDALTAGNLKNTSTGATGIQYFNTYGPISGDGNTVMTFTPQRFNLPFFETCQCIAELGNTVLVGCKGNVIYPWNQIDVLPSDLINIPENNVVTIITVNNMGYIFAGSKGNIYLTNGSTASPAISVPDYCAGIAGTPASYFEPYFTWGGAMYLRGRVYFSILDQTSTKAGNCGGVWSFVPTNNIYIGQDTGLSLRIENQNSYGTYSGVAPVLLVSQTQTVISPQYWSAWYSSITSPSYGIDFTNTSTSTTAIIETDLIPTGYLLGEQKKTFQNIEYKLSSPLAVGESVSCAYRKTSTESYTDMGTANVETTTSQSGYFTANFENTKWLQLKITLTPLSNSNSTFVRLTEIIIR